MMLRRRMTRTEKMKLDFMKSQLAEFGSPGGFAISAREHKATPTEKENTLKRIRMMKERLEKMKKPVEV